MNRSEKLTVAIPFEFKHYISLGFNCFVARGLERYGLRDSSYPFDWVKSEYDGVYSLIANGFDGFLKYDNLYQNRENHHIYTDKKYGIDYLHDFVKNYSLKKQINKVRKKYSRRIDRFKKNITEPTLFFRYIKRESELDYLLEHHEDVLNLLKSFCSENNIIYITSLDGIFPKYSDIPNLFFSEKPENETRKWSEYPFEGNDELLDYIKNAVSDTKADNLRFNSEKEERKKEKCGIIEKIKKKIDRVLKKHFFKDYIHDKQCD